MLLPANIHISQAADVETVVDRCSARIGVIPRPHRPVGHIGGGDGEGAVRDVGCDDGAHARSPNVAPTTKLLSAKV